MSRQQTFSDLEYDSRSHTTKREAFLAQMEASLPLRQWAALVQPHYHEGRRGRPPRDVDVMLRMYLLRRWYALSARRVQDAVYDSYAMRRFVGLNFLEQQVPNATTLLAFERMLRRTGIDRQMEREAAQCLRTAGVRLQARYFKEPGLVRRPRDER